MDYPSFDELRRRERYAYKDSYLCFKNIELDSSIENKAPLRISVENISYSGLGIICSRSINVGSMLVFNINNGDENREMMLEVRWTRYENGVFRAGLQFLGLTKDDVYFLHEIIKKIRKREKLTN